ncbi:LPS translocon maturation chaperone LptM [Endozoicomonas ascidiicola]|nr:lipoprotein [Endozoicomonas ascidiicola]
MRLFAAATFMVLFLAGCGQKGDLYLPKTSQATSEAAVQLPG